jgi:hypothetical protein
MSKVIVYRSFGARVEYQPEPSRFEAEYERLSSDPNIDYIQVEESE